jgi:hypothetical protein
MGSSAPIEDDCALLLELSKPSLELKLRSLLPYSQAHAIYGVGPVSFGGARPIGPGAALSMPPPRGSGP